MAYLDRFRLTSGGEGTPDPLAPSAEHDDQGERQIGYDQAAWTEMQRIALPASLPLLGEEDEFRGRKGGPALRGQRVRELIEADTMFAVADPLDGSNQAAGMGQRSGWACCAMVIPTQIRQTAIAVLLGDGRGFVCSGERVRFSEATHPDRARVSYDLQANLSVGSLERPHYVIPAAKRSALARAAHVLDADASIGWISPLGGNPGILAAMLGAGAVAAMQPAAYAWDHFAAVILATAGFTVLSQSGTDAMTGAQVTEMLLRDLVAGRKTESLYIGRTSEFAERLRDADREA